MPRKARTGRRTAGSYSGGHRLQLLAGHDFFGDGFGDGDAFRREEAEAAWLVLREELLLGHIKDRPCTRPWAWWEFEDHPPRRAAKADAAALRQPWMSEIYPEWWAEYRSDPWYESQAAYLKRHRMLTPREAEYLSRHPELLNPVHVSESKRQ